MGSNREYHTYPIDSHGHLYDKPTAQISLKEQVKIIHEINSVYHARFSGKHYGAIRSYDLNGQAKTYKFEIHGFDEYNIYSAKPNDD